ncbi:SDR family oxidoreductase [Rhizobium sp. BK251]|uniref:UDP-glucose 4-epimerase family protein n=1 Tax=Rhizobium sp. BK251 TaxID=2512125 RepID=UPI00104518D6|nr:SDR family oxidoreductase [Rhizobium sp. BK251]TCL75717.1 nucleoside-diphosphate-sugar epimerase [Rhizobium sp. BK251]
MILVTGATGFVGSALVAELRRRELGFRAVSRSERDGFYRVGDINETTDWSAALPDIDTVVHLAARVHVMRETVADPTAAFRAANVTATINLARQAAAAGVRRFIYMSSVKVNGEATPKDQPFTPAEMPKPQDAYGLSKWEAEEALFQLGRATRMEIVIIRPPLVYGPGVKANFASLMKWTRRGVPLPLAAVENKRSLVYVGNLADFILRCAEHPAAANRVFLVSDFADLSTAELITRLAKAMNRKPNLITVPPSLLKTAARIVGKGDMAQRLLGSLQVDPSDDRELLGWTPPYPIDEALRLTVEAFLREENT